MSGFSTARQKMVDGQVRPSDVTDIRIIDAMLAVPREAFVPDKQARAGLSRPRSRCRRGRFGRAVPDQARGAGENAAGGRNQGNRPRFGGGLRQRLCRRGDRQICRAGDGDRERFGAGRKARPPCRNGCGNVAVRTVAAGEGDAANAPFDVIVVCGATEIVPEQLYGQLRDGGRLVGVFAMSQPPRATIVTHSHGDFGTGRCFDAAAPVLPGMERLPAFVF